MIFWRKKTKQEQNIENRQKRLMQDFYSSSFSWSTILRYSLFFVTTLLVSFWGQEPIRHQIFINYPSKLRLIATVDFEYESEVKTNILKEQRKQMVAPVYRVDMGEFRKFANVIEYLKEKLEVCAAIQDKNALETTLNNLIEEFDSKYNFNLEKTDLLTLLNISTTLQRTRLLDESLFVLQETVQHGIFDDTDFNQTNDKRYFNWEQDETFNRFLSRGNAMRTLRMNLSVMDIEYDVANALIHIFKYGIVPNLVYDKKRTQDRVNQYIEKTPNVVVKVLRGTVIVDNGQMVTPEVYEAYLAYQKNLENEEVYRAAHFLLMGKKIFLFTLLFAILALIFKMVPTKLNSSLHLCVVTCCLLILNVALIRLVNICCLHTNFGHQFVLASFSAFLVPTFLSSMLITALTDVLVGFLCTFFIVGIKTFIIFGTLDTFLLDLLTGILIVFLCRKVCYKKDLIRAGIYAHLLLAILVFITGKFVQDLSFGICMQQVLAIAFSGIFSIFLVINIISVMEKFFHYTTDITFLELTDYNHPLLRKLQLVAPGTYHHSLMVAALAEKVASEVGANPLLCRCCSLYHDIGKMIKPEYFTENQKENENPHQYQTPSMSAIILKSHVKEGIELAKAYKLPYRVVDVIKQHHGTSLMKYFYKKAMLLKAEDEEIDERIFRYDGPKPQFKESAIISLADAIEAASRSLEKITPQSVSELIDKIIKDKIDSDQFNECNITLQDIDIIRKSFQISLLSMLHSRVSYEDIKVETTASNSDNNDK